MSSESLHESAEKIGAEAIDTHRAIVSLMEELEAVDWYNQRAKATSNPDLRAILEHNRDEEKEHAAMVLEWLRRTDPKLSQHLKTFLFTEGPITEIEAEAIHGAGGGGEAGGEATAAGDGSLGIGSLRNAGGDK
jgi:ferritin-like protein